MDKYQYYINIYKQCKDNDDFINFLNNNQDKIKKLDETILTNDDINKDIIIKFNENEIKNKLLANNLVTIRMGCVETGFFLKYKYNKTVLLDHNKYDSNIDFYMKRNAGLYYRNDTDKEKVCTWFCDNLDELIKNPTITLTSCYSVLHFDLTLYSLYNFKNIYLHNWGPMYKVIMTNLNNKNILVISNAVETLKKSYDRGLENVYNIQISKFNKIDFIKTPQTTLGLSYPDDNMIVTTEKIVNLIINNYNDFDTIFLACGAYGPMITNYLVKKFKNKNIIYLGSLIYTMFGLYTHDIRIPFHDNNFKHSNFIEVDQICPEECKNIDGGKYWKKLN